jgi:LL-H family phage holin
MSDIIFEIIKLIVMLIALAIARYLIPWLRTKLESEKINLISQWTKKAVLMAQQTLASESGSEKKQLVSQFLSDILSEINIELPENQIDVLIESAVKEMKIEENSGITIEATDVIQSDKEG